MTQRLVSADAPGITSASEVRRWSANGLLLAGRPTLLVGNGKGMALRFPAGTCGVLGDSCGHPELPRRDADEALEEMAELALVREAGAGGDLRQGQVGSCLQELPGPLDAAQDRGPARPARGSHWPYGSFLRA